MGCRTTYYRKKAHIGKSNSVTIRYRPDLCKDSVTITICLFCKEYDGCDPSTSSILCRHCQLYSDVWLTFSCIK